MTYSLANGARILSLSVHMHDDGGCSGVVLAELDSSNTDRYVTWSVWTNEPENLNMLSAVNGRYFATLRQARDDYRSRI